MPTQILSPPQSLRLVFTAACNLLSAVGVAMWFSVNKLHDAESTTPGIR